MQNAFNNTTMNAVSQQSCNSPGRSRYTGRGEWQYAAPLHPRPPPLSQHTFRLLLCKHCSKVNAAWHYVQHAAVRNLIRDAASAPQLSLSAVSDTASWNIVKVVRQ